MKMNLELSDILWYKNISDNFAKIMKENYSTSILQSDQFNNIFNNIKEEQPYHINLLDELHANENSHSRILVKLLKYKKNKHFPILTNFIKSISSSSEGFIFNHKINKPIITAEKHRIDALIVDENYAIIIENKIHNAKDQPDQIKRYIEEVEKYNISSNNIYVIYMTRNGSAPDENSFPTELREKFKNRTKLVSYRYDIHKWLKNEIKPVVQSSDEYLDSALVQYIDHLEGMFQLRKTNKDMNRKLEMHLNEMLELSSNPEENIRTISEKIKELTNINKYLEDIRIKNYFEKWANNIEKDFENCEIIKEYEDINDFPRVGIKMQHKGVVFYILIEKEDNLYFGIATPDTINQQLMSEIKNALKDDIYTENVWYTWKYTDYRKAYYDLKKLIDTISHEMIYNTIKKE